MAKTNPVDNPTAPPTPDPSRAPSPPGVLLSPPPAPPAPAARSICLDVGFDFARGELSIGFDRADRARAYQARNHEARILAADPRTAWLPVPAGASRLRASRAGLVLHFARAADAAAWCRRVAVARPYRGGGGAAEEGRAYIRRDWPEEELQRELAEEPRDRDRERAASNPSPTGGRGEAGAAPEESRRDDEGFGGARGAAQWPAPPKMSWSAPRTSWSSSPYPEETKRP